MWYSWSDANSPEHSTLEPDTLDNAGDQPRWTSQALACFPTLLQVRDVSGCRSFLAENLPAAHLTFLWRSFLINVHPLVKIFFDWEVESLFKRADSEFPKLSSGEQALIFAIVLLAVLSLSPEECANQILEDKTQLLKSLQTCVETSLIVADFSTTTDRSTLQAFMLYLVSIRTWRQTANDVDVFS